VDDAMTRVGSAIALFNGSKCDGTAGAR